MSLMQFLIILLLVVLYFFPTIKAYYSPNERVRKRVGDYFIFNMMIGWTIVGWILLVIQQAED
jgi:hypothetical protein